jgi:hypothetical protein
MRKLFITITTFTAITSSALAQNFTSFSAGLPELKLNNEVVLEKEADAVRYPISLADSRAILKESEGEQYALGKVGLSKTTVVLYYTKPAGVAPLGKITATTFTHSGKKIASEAIGVFADFAGMHFNTSFTITSQDKGAISVSSNVTALKDSGEVNPDMSKISVYHIAAKGKITKM